MLQKISKNIRKNSGLAQIPLILGLLLMAIAIPIATKLSQQSQDTRNRAAGHTRYKCEPDSGGCVQDPGGEFLNLSECAANCRASSYTCSGWAVNCKPSGPGEDCRNHGMINGSGTCPSGQMCCKRPSSTSTPIPTSTSVSTSCGMTSNGCKGNCSGGRVCKFTGMSCACVAPTSTPRPTNTPRPTSASCGITSSGCRGDCPGSEVCKFIGMSCACVAPTSTPRPTNTPRPTSASCGITSSGCRGDCPGSEVCKFIGMSCACVAPTSTPRPTNTPRPTSASCGITSSGCRGDCPGSEVCKFIGMSCACVAPTSTPRPTGTNCRYIGGGKCSSGGCPVGERCAYMAYSVCMCVKSNLTPTSIVRVTSTPRPTRRPTNTTVPTATRRPTVTRVPTASVSGDCYADCTNDSQCVDDLFCKLNTYCWGARCNAGPATRMPTSTSGPGGPTLTSVPVTPVPTNTGAPPPPPTSKPPSPTQTPGGPTVTSGGPTATPVEDCDYDSLQAQVQTDSTSDWTSQLVLNRGDRINLGCMHDGSGQLAENVKITAGHSDGTNYEFETNLESQWAVPEEGNYTVWCESVDPNCDGLVSTTNATLTVGGMCKECPNDFHCYGHAQYGYAWFVTGYEMEDYNISVDQYCVEDVGPMPSWLGKGQGDADCNGKIDGNDYSVWRREYVDISGGDVMERDNWEADFTGPAGECDGIVDGYDYSLWRRSYIDVFGGDN